MQIWGESLQSIKYISISLSLSDIIKNYLCRTKNCLYFRTLIYLPRIVFSDSVLSTGNIESRQEHRYTSHYRAQGGDGECPTCYSGSKKGSPLLRENITEGSTYVGLIVWQIGNEEEMETVAKESINRNRNLSKQNTQVRNREWFSLARS